MINKDYSGLISPIRRIKGKVELLNSGSTSPVEYTCEDALKSFTISRAGEHGKFFGFGVFHKIEIKLVDNNREIDIPKDSELKAWIQHDNEDFVSIGSTFYTEEPKRDEKTNELTITAYDKLNAAAAHTFAELNLQAPYTIRNVVEACQNLLNIPSIAIGGSAEQSFELVYNEGANFDGTETLRYVLDTVAEATQTYYFIENDILRFRRLIVTGTPVLTIRKEDYMELSCNPTIILSDIASTTELGDNITATTGESGVTQYVKDNPFWNLRDDTATLVENAVSAMGGISNTPFECSWRGNYLLQIGDKIGLITKDDTTITSYLLDETLTYNGGLNSKIQWKFEATEGSGHSNPSTLGEALKQTFAKVDKVSKQITMAVDDISQLKLDTSGIEATVTGLTEKASLAMTEDQVKIAIDNELSNGVDKVVTTTGFTFDDTGLTVNKTGSEITTTITEDGMTINKNSNEVLVANNQGVKAKDLHATTYLIVGSKSRFEDYGGRTGCFWIGG